MKVVLVNTQIGGGAFVACKRLAAALRKSGVEVELILLKASRLNFLLERLRIFIANGFTRRNLFAVSIANTGTDISQFPAVQSADIIHLHWINQGALSLNNLQQLQKLGKPIVWTCHDMWPFTGICHHARECVKYAEECKLCPFLNKKRFIFSELDLSTIVFRKKLSLYGAANLTFVTCSKWLKSKGDLSKVSCKNKIVNIPNPLDVDLYAPIDKTQARQHFNLPLDKKLILFGAANTADKRKGFDYFIEACRILVEQHWQTPENCAIVSYGHNSDSLQSLVPFKVYSLGFVSGDSNLVALYNAVDTFVIPSLEENLPNTIMEAMSCNTPCVGFAVGGIPEMITHKQNGYVAEYKNVNDLAVGINYVLEQHFDATELRNFVVEHFSESVVAQQYIELYKSLLQ